MNTQPFSGRADRVARRIQGELSERLLDGTFHDPRLQGVVVTRVWVSEDAQIARIYVRTFNCSDGTEESRVLAGLKSASPRIHRAVGKALTLRRVPSLQFYWDEALDEVRQVESVLEELTDATAEGG